MSLSVSSARTQVNEGKARAKLPWLIFTVLLIILPALIRIFSLELTTFPESWNFGLREPIDAFQSWVIVNRADSPWFVWFFDPIKNSINTSVKSLESALRDSPWPVIMLLAFWLGLKANGLRLALFCALSFLFMGIMDLWKESMQTLALMGVSVAISLLIGIPLGIVSALNDKFKAFIRPILDVMQTLPAFVYLIPMVLFFGIARAPSVIATVIYALAPAIRYTDLGIRQVPAAALEASKAFGATRRQMLLKVQLPLALPQIVAGINQTIMMAFGIVVIAALIGANGLGRTVLQALQRLEVGRGFEAGLAIALMAIALDRVSRGFSNPRPQTKQERPSWVKRHALDLGFLVAIATLYVINRFRELADFPETWQLSMGDPIDTFVTWSRDNLYQLGDLPLGTGPFSDFLVSYGINPLLWFLQSWLVWPLVIVATAYLVSLISNWKLGVFAFVSLFCIGFLGMWEHMLVSLSQVIVGTILTVILALGLGIASARRDSFKRILEPVLDMLQTIPSFVYLIPVIMLFNIGYIPGIMASILYALPPGIRMIDLGIRQVKPQTIEAARAFGATPGQLLRQVQLPLALPSIMLGVNQIIMMILAMVVIAGLVGSGGLGLEAVIGLAKNQTGRGIEAGIAIVLLAMIMDRAIQSWAAKQRVV